MINIEKVAYQPPAPVIEPTAAVHEQKAPVHEPTASTSASDSYRPAVGHYYIYEVISKVDGYEFYTCRYKNSKCQIRYIYYFVFILNFSLLTLFFIKYRQFLV